MTAPTRSTNKIKNNASKKCRSPQIMQTNQSSSIEKKRRCYASSKKNQSILSLSFINQVQTPLYPLPLHYSWLGYFNDCSQQSRHILHIFNTCTFPFYNFPMNLHEKTLTWHCQSAHVLSCQFRSTLAKIITDHEITMP